MVVIREQTEGLFAGRHDAPGGDPDVAQDWMVVTRAGCERLFGLAFEQARRRGHVTVFDRANVLRSQALMRRVFDEVAERYPDVGAARLYIDNAAMLMVRDPGRFDVVVMENQFGDIVSEIAAGIGGGLGIAPSADVGPGHAVFQPCHGTAPDIAGMGVANPVAAILSAAMLLEHVGEAGAAGAVRGAVETVLREGPWTRDLGGSAGARDVADAVEGAL